MALPVRSSFFIVAGLLVMAACRAEAPPPVPSLSAAPSSTSREAGVAAVATSQASLSDAGPGPDPEQGCLSPQGRAAALACPRIPPVDQMTLFDLQGRVAARATPKRARTDFAPRPLSPDAVRYVEAAQAFVCSAPEGEEQSEARYSLGRTYFEAQHWEEAAIVFHEAAKRPGDDVAQYALQLSLECLAVLATKAGKPACRGLVVAWAREGLNVYCTKQAPGTEELCRMLPKILTDVQASPTLGSP